MYAFALRNTTVNHIRGCVVKILYPTLPRFQSKMAIVWDRSMTRIYGSIEHNDLTRCLSLAIVGTFLLFLEGIEINERLSVHHN